MGNIAKTFQELSLKDRLKAIRKRPVIVVDTSFSMASDVEPGQTKYEAVIAILKGLNGNPKVWAFSDHVRETTIDELEKAGPHGGTVLSPVLQRMKDQGYREAVVITDGEVNDYDQDASLKAVEGLVLKVLYVGPGEKPEFLEKLANASGGFCDKDDLHFVSELTGKVQLLLGETPDYTIKL